MERQMMETPMQEAVQSQMMPMQEGVQGQVMQNQTAQQEQSDLEEYFFNGYCKAKNQTRLVTCEYSIETYGLCLERIEGCDYLECQYNKDCDIVKRALAKEDE